MLMPAKYRHLSVYKLYVLGLAVGLVLFLVSAFIARSDGLSVLETRVFHYVYDLRDVWRPLLLATTQLGSGWFLVVLTLGGVLAKKRQLAYQMMFSGVFTFVLVEAAKLIIDRPRPAFLLPEILQREIFVRGLGFPSGHTAMATVLSLTLLPYIPKGYRFIVPLWIVGVGFSRIYLGVHAPLDIVGGFGLGLLVACSLKLFSNKRKVDKHKGYNYKGIYENKKK